MIGRVGVCAAVACAAAMIAMSFAAHESAQPRKPDRTRLASYSTSLAVRTESQRHNARLAAEALNGAVIAPGGVLSFNKRVRSWTWDRGYVKAPVSYGGELVPAYGGGVCQTSTTLYNAALIAGMEIVERHRHEVLPHYAPPGRDAAVAQVAIDLRIRNPLPASVAISARCVGSQLTVALDSQAARDGDWEVRTVIHSSTSPAARVARRPWPLRTRARTALRSPGAAGATSVTYRIHRREGIEVSREVLSRDTYRTLDRIVAIVDQDAPSERY